MDDAQERKVNALKTIRADCLTLKSKSMAYTDELDVRVKAVRPRFKAGSELSGKVNLVVLTINQIDRDEQESLDVDLKWTTELSSNCEE
jgi:hypothetical protein